MRILKGLAVLCLGQLLLSGGCSHGQGQSPTAIHYPTWSPTGAQIAFVASYEGLVNPQIWVLSLGSGKPEARLLRRARHTEGWASWRPDGKALAVGAPGEDQPDTAEMWLLPVGGTLQPVRLAARAGGNLGFPHWSPDGAQLACMAAGEDGWGTLLVLDTAHRKERRLDTSAEPFFPEWSPGGVWIAFSGGRRPGEGEEGRGIYVISPDGTGERRLNCPARGHFVWATADEVLYGSVGPNGGFELWQVSVKTGKRVRVFGPTQLPQLDMGQMLPKWDRRHRRLLAVAENPQHPSPPTGITPLGDIYRLDLADGATHRLTNLGRDYYPAWSGDGSRIAFVRDWNSLWVMSADGSGQREIVEVRELRKWASR